MSERPTKPSAHRSEQAAPPAELEAPAGEHECGDDCMPARNLHFRTAAPPADDVRVRVTHEEAAFAIERTGQLHNYNVVIRRYIAQQAELERLARSTVKARSACATHWCESHASQSEPGCNDCLVASRNDEAFQAEVDALAELLGTEES